ncbi:MAG: alpha/beta hydrolase-fold protein [Cyclobacteriaceae bacterium]
MSKFRTTEISDPQFESDNLRFITVKTKNLKGRGDICVFVPEGSTGRDLPITILLHGVYGSCWCWSQKAGAHRTAQRLIDQATIEPMVIAMPSDGLWGDGSGYLEHNGSNFEKWIAEDVPAAVRENIEQTSDGSSIYIAGLSMGGYGALRIGSKYPEVFKGISGHSSITSLGQMSQFVEEPLEEYFQKDKQDEDVLETMLANKNQLPPIRFDCGNTDQLIENNRTLHRQMENEGIGHQYQEFSGGHEWEYWAEHLEKTLIFFNGINKDIP